MTLSSTLTCVATLGLTGAVVAQVTLVQDAENIGLVATHVPAESAIPGFQERMVGGIAVEAIDRLRNPGEVAGSTVLWVASLGIVINGATALLFMRGRDTDLNIRGAYLHMAADAGVSFGVVVAAHVLLALGFDGRMG